MQYLLHAPYTCIRITLLLIMLLFIVIGSILNKVPSLSNALKLLKKKSADWDAIGRALDSVSGNDTSNERTGLHRNMALSDFACLEIILKTWLQQGGISSTWGQLKEALKEDYYDVVNKIEEFLGLPLSKK